MDQDGYIKLADFGLSKIVSEKNNQIKVKKDKKDTEEYLCGTLEYLSPDVILKRQYDFHTDLWSFGVLIFEMLTGYVRFLRILNDQAPFFDSDRKKLLQKIVN